MAFEDELQTFMAAIRRNESGSPQGNYLVRGPTITNPNSAYYGERAYGAYQIMPGNWAGWAAQAGIPGADWRDPAAQDRVARHKFTEYYNRYGDWRLVAVAWFAGPGRADTAKRAGISSVAGITDTLGTSIATYVRKIEEYLISQGAAPSGAAGAVPDFRTALGAADDLQPGPGSGGVEMSPRDVLAASLSALSDLVAGGSRAPLRSPVEDVQRLGQQTPLDEELDQISLTDAPLGQAGKAAL